MSESPSQEQLEQQEATNKSRISRADIFKFGGLLVFFALMGAIVFLGWPYISDVFSEGGVERLVTRVQEAGAAGVFILLGMQFLQIVVAFIPGELVQLAAGLMYGPFWGGVVVLLGCVISSSAIYWLVHKLGAPFVQGMVPTTYLEKFRHFEEKGTLDVIVFILFLIPGLPKDVFTYLVPLTDMKYTKFIVLTTIGRIPGVFASTYIAAGIDEGNLVGPIVVAVILAVLAVLGIVFKDKLLERLAKHSGKTNVEDIQGE